MIVPLRTRLRRHVIGMAQCLRSWSKAVIYQPISLSVPLKVITGNRYYEILPRNPLTRAQLTVRIPLSHLLM
ncbi:hypothetical protein GGS21DRAFT_510866 [Xylaria nigripes]|nr:hypothetical protein GGS21DRAFT_510866 [Xylaria nigripes]